MKIETNYGLLNSRTNFLNNQKSKENVVPIVIPKNKMNFEKNGMNKLKMFILALVATLSNSCQKIVKNTNLPEMQKYVQVLPTDFNLLKSLDSFSLAARVNKDMNCKDCALMYEDTLSFPFVDDIGNKITDIKELGARCQYNGDPCSITIEPKLLVKGKASKDFKVPVKYWGNYSYEPVIDR